MPHRHDWRSRQTVRRNPDFFRCEKRSICCAYKKTPRIRCPVNNSSLYTGIKFEAFYTLSCSFQELSFQEQLQQHPEPEAGA